MSGRAVVVAVASILAACAMSAPAQAKILKFHVNLDGKYGTEPTGSPATGRAAVLVDTATKRISVDLDVQGITVDQLWAKLVAKPIGPIHFHKYMNMTNMANMAGASSVLALPLPYGPSYRPTSNGIHVVMKNFDYASDAALVQSDVSFDDFVADMKNGLIVLNVHTNKFNPGEISGLVVPN